MWNFFFCLNFFCKDLKFLNLLFFERIFLSLFSSAIWQTNRTQTKLTKIFGKKQIKMDDDWSDVKINEKKIRDKEKIFKQYFVMSKIRRSKMKDYPWHGKMLEYPWWISTPICCGYSSIFLCPGQLFIFNSPIFDVTIPPLPKKIIFFCKCLFFLTQFSSTSSSSKKLLTDKRTLGQTYSFLKVYVGR